LASSDDLVIEGVVDGPVSGDGAVTLAAGSTVNGEVRGQRVVVAGTLRHSVYATHSVRLAATAELYGDLHAPRFSVDEGAVFEGQVRMRAAAPTVQPERRAPDSPMRVAAAASPVAAPVAAAPAVVVAAAAPPAPAERAIPELPMLGKRKLVRRTR
jgi:cytoskeletal protein CcmA (bactofilin family)